jgi:broad specificity phosphatase PhoE
MRLHAQDWHTAAQIDRELKTQAKSIANRLATLKGFGLVEENANDVGSYKYSSKISETDETIALLAEEYKIRRYQIYELIFSQNKQIKNFADAFVVVNKKNKKGDENG